MRHMPACAGERAHIGRLYLVADGTLNFHAGVAGVDRNLGLLIGKQDPVARLLGQIAPRRIDVDAERDENVAQVLPAPGPGPRCHCAFADGQGRVGHHRRLSNFVDTAQPVALWACAFRRVWREGLGLKMRLPGRIFPGA